MIQIYSETLQMGPAHSSILCDTRGLVLKTDSKKWELKINRLQWVRPSPTPGNSHPIHNCKSLQPILMIFIDAKAVIGLW